MTEGKVFALDIEQKMLDELAARLRFQQFQNIELMHGPIECVPMADETVEHVIASLVLHEVDPLSKGIDEIRRVLKPGGHCFCLEWGKIPYESGPPLVHRIFSDDMVKIFRNTGFTVISKSHPTEEHYILIVRKED